MARKAKPSKPANDRQIALLDVPEEPHLVELVKHYRHTASTALKDGPRCFFVCELLENGVGIERICARVTQEFGKGISPHTVRRIRSQLNGGNLAGWKEEMLRSTKELASDLVDSLREDLFAGRMTPGEKSVLLGISTDKIDRLEGVPGLVVEHRHQVVLNVDRVNAMLSGLPIPESSSGETPALSAPIDVPSLTGPCVGPYPPAPVPVETGRDEGGGGGCAPAPAAADLDTLPPGESPAKETLTPP